MPLKDTLPLLGITYMTALRLIKKDEFPVPVRRVGGQWKVPTAALQRFLDSPVTEKEPA